MVKSVIKSLIVAFIIILLCSMSAEVFADNNELLLFSDPIVNNTVSGNLLADPPNNTVNNTNTANNIPTLNTPTLTTNNTISSIPNTGESDIYVVTALIIVSAIVTVYAYKKIRDYNSF